MSSFTSPHSRAALGLVAGLLALLAASCTTPSRPPSKPISTQPPPAAPRTAAEAGFTSGPALASLSVSGESAARALAAFRISCPSLLTRKDASQLTVAGDWSVACAAAAAWPEQKALEFFAGHFDTVVVGDGKAFATGYYEPRIAGSRTRMPGYEVPIYKVPGDLIDLDLSIFQQNLAGRRLRGRVEGNEVVPYHDRVAIEDGALAGRGLEIAWAADPVDLFFLQIQGSGQLRLPDGSIMRIGYAGQNGREYVGIGGLLRQRGLISSPVTMQAIVDWLRAHPAEGRAIMRENKSYVFFTELRGPGPLGALGRPVTPRASVAADPKFVPLGAPLVLTTERGETNGLWIAQDTGGAIKGANRFDTFWGAGDEAAHLAGGMSARGQAWLLLPKGVLARRGGNAAAGR